MPSCPLICWLRCRKRLQQNMMPAMGERVKRRRRRAAGESRRVGDKINFGNDGYRCPPAQESAMRIATGQLLHRGYPSSGSAGLQKEECPAPSASVPVISADPIGATLNRMRSEGIPASCPWSPRQLELLPRLRPAVRSLAQSGRDRPAMITVTPNCSSCVRCCCGAESSVISVHGVGSRRQAW